jgi:hypothetical protein
MCPFICITEFGFPGVRVEASVLEIKGYGFKHTLSLVKCGGRVGNLLHFFWQQYTILADVAMRTRFAM